MHEDCWHRHELLGVQHDSFTRSAGGTMEHLMFLSTSYQSRRLLLTQLPVNETVSINRYSVRLRRPVFPAPPKVLAACEQGTMAVALQTPSSPGQPATIPTKPQQRSPRSSQESSLQLMGAAEGGNEGSSSCCTLPSHLTSVITISF